MATIVIRSILDVIDDMVVILILLLLSTAVAVADDAVATDADDDAMLLMRMHPGVVYLRERVDGGWQMADGGGRQHFYLAKAFVEAALATG